MGGLVVRVAIGLGLVHPGWLDRLVHVGSPLRGAPVAFRAAYDKLTLPLINELHTLIRWKNASLFTEHMHSCFQGFYSIYQLMPPAEHSYVGYAPDLLWNPLAQRAVPKSFRDAAFECHRLLEKASAVLASAQTPVFTIHTNIHTGHQTDLYYQVRVRRGAGTDYELVEVTGRTKFGDGTVPESSATDGRALGVQNVDHAYMCDDPKVVAVLVPVLD